MTLPSSHSQDPSDTGAPTPAGARSSRSQQFAWGPSNQQQTGRRGLTPISTGFNSSSARQPAGTNSPSRNAFSPVNSASTSLSLSSNRHIASRTSSASSSSPFSPLPSGSQQLSTNQLLSSTRPRTIASSASSHLASFAAASQTSSQGGGGATGSGGGAPRLARASPSLSQSGVGSPGIALSSQSTQGAGQAGQLSKIVIAQIFLLLSSIKEDKDKTKWDNQVEQIRKLVDSNGMDVYEKYFRRLVQANAPKIFPGSGGSIESPGSYRILVDEMKMITRDQEKVNRMVEAIDTTEGDVFRDFDLSTFMEHFRLDPLAKTALALAFKTASKPDLRTKADAILSNNLQPFFATLASPTEPAEGVEASYLAVVVERLLQDPPRNWNEENKTSLEYALQLRYKRTDTPIPPEITTVLQLLDLLASHNTLVHLVHRTGPKGTASLEACKEMLAAAEVRDIGYQQVACVLLFMVMAQKGQAYEPGVFVSALRQHRAGQRLDWQDVVHSFDREGLVVTKRQFLGLYDALLPLAHEYENFDIQLLWGDNWDHLITQLSFVVAFLSHSAEELDASQIPRLRTAFDLEQFQDASDEVKAAAAKAVKHPFVSLDATTTLFSTIFRSQEYYAHAQSLGIPNRTINSSTDIFVVAASGVPRPWVGLQDQALRQLFHPFLAKDLPNYNFVLHGVWKHDREFVIMRLFEAYLTDRMLLPLILEHAQEHGWIEDLANTGLNSGSDISIDLVALAHSRGLFDLEAWSTRLLQIAPQAFARAVFELMKRKAEDEVLVQREHQPRSTVFLPVKTVHLLLGCLQEHVSDEDLLVLQRECVAAYPRLINYGEGFDAIIDANGEASNAMSEEADAKMQDQYKKMYSQDSDVRDVIATLQRLKVSEDAADQDLFACMIHGLFDEYNCFGEYPLEALATTAVLFGGVINYNLLSRVALQVGLGMVLQAVSEWGPEDAMYKFGLQALMHFLDRLHEWPSFCDRLLRCPGIHGTEAYDKVEEILRGEMGVDTNGTAQNGLVLTNGAVDDFLEAEPSVSPFTCLHVDPPAHPELYEEPDEDIQEKVQFVLNNVSVRNFENKLQDLRNALERQHHQWFAAVLVEQRGKQQPNYQQLYLNLLDSYDDKALWALVLRETYLNVFRMLNAESTMNSSSERGHLKNLGGWLGSLTLARNRPIKYKNISFKDLLTEGYDSQRLLAVIPFTCKVLLQAAQSTVFKPPNPWIMEIIRLLVELYHTAELKLNLKFEIEVLCKDLDLDLKTIEPSDAIQGPRPIAEEELLGQVLPNGMEGFADLSLMGLNRVRGPNERFSPATITAALPDLGSLLHYPPASNGSHHQLKQIFLTAAQQAIHEIIAPVVERSVTIAAISTAQLVDKDFATEPNVDRYRESAHTVVKSLSGSLALVTCKEPLRMSITNNIRIMAGNLAQQEGRNMLPEGNIIMFVNDNLDTVCSLVEQAAENQSMAEIDTQIEEALERRRRHQATRPNEQFISPNLSGWALLVPPPYRQAPGGLNGEQLAIYEDFGRQSRGIPNHANTVSQDSGRQMPDVLQDHFPSLSSLPTPAEAPAMPRPGPQQQPRLPSAMSMQTTSTQPHMNGFVELHNIADRVQELLAELQRAAHEASEEHIEELAPSAPTREICDQLIHIIEASGQKDNLALGAAQRVTAVVYSEGKRPLEIEVLASVLHFLCTISVATARQVLIWLANIEDDRVFNILVTVSFLKMGLMDIHRVDVTVSKAIQQRRNIALEFMLSLTDDVLGNDQVAVLRVDFARTFEALAQWLADEPGVELGRQVMSRLQPSAPFDALPSPPSSEKHDQLEYIFEEWYRLQRPETSEKSYAAFIHQLHERQIINNQEDSAMFFRVCIDASITAFDIEEQMPFGQLNRAYACVDALAKLITSLVLYQGELDGAVKGGRVAYLDSILSLVVLVLCQHHQTRLGRFNHKVFFRLFSAILLEFHAAKSASNEQQMRITPVFAKAMLATQPKFFPGFAISWLALVSHRLFMPALLKMPDQSPGPSMPQHFE
ncbi:hypothetical protein B0A49_03826 [Cryomyces minteri]|uniref:General negative regulator of transcription subunit 1 n=1 Tax=Cryomyces minteri TaxID=331657 RepID=A0A4U0XM86_9PEZI|nr:hypothetical protein B0A49_03826 [Cryomyces minteri]